MAGGVLSALLLVSFLQSQNLADLAKKEKARRAALKGKRATVITTADLAKAKRRPAVESTTQEQAAEGTEEAAQAQEGVTPPATQATEAAAAQVEKPAEETPLGPPRPCPHRISRRNKTSWRKSPSRRPKWSTS